MDTTTTELGSRIDALRTDLGMTVLDLSIDAKIPLTTLQRRLSGDGRLTVPELTRISSALNVTPASWFSEVAA